MSRSIAIASVLVVVFALATRAVPARERADDKVTLRLNLAKGDVSRTKATMVSTQSMSLPTQLAGDQGTGMDSRVEFEQEMEQRVVDVADDGSMTMETTFLRIRGKMTSPFDEGSLEFDSAKPAGEDPTAKMLASLTGKSVKMVFGPGGQLTSVQGMSELMKTMLDESDPAVAGPFLGLFSGDQLKELFDDLYPGLPREPVGVGDSWTVEEPGTAGFPIAMKVVYKVTGIDADGVEVAIEGTMKSSEIASPPPEPAQPPPADQNKEPDLEASIKEVMANMKMDATMTGTQRFSRRDGLVERSTIVAVTTTSVPMPDDKPPMKVSQSITTTWELVPAGEKK